MHACEAFTGLSVHLALDTGGWPRPSVCCVSDAKKHVHHLAIAAEYNDDHEPLLSCLSRHIRMEGSPQMIVAGGRSYDNRLLDACEMRRATPIEHNITTIQSRL